MWLAWSPLGFLGRPGPPGRCRLFRERERGPGAGSGSWAPRGGCCGQCQATRAEHRPLRPASTTAPPGAPLPPRYLAGEAPGSQSSDGETLRGAELRPVEEGPRPCDGRAEVGTVGNIRPSQVTSAGWVPGQGLSSDFGRGFLLSAHGAVNPRQLLEGGVGVGFLSSHLCGGKSMIRRNQLWGLRGCEDRD